MAKKNEEIITRPMPVNPQAEKAVLGAILIDREAADTMIPALREDDFYDPANSTIFAAMKSIQNSSGAIDILTVCDALEIVSKLNDVGGAEYLTELSGVLPSAANAQYYYDIVRRDGLLRRIIHAGNSVTQIGYNELDVQNALAEAEKMVFGISQTTDRSAFKDIVQASTEAIDEIEHTQNGDNLRTVVRTGFDQFDSITNGLKGGDFALLAARPSVGKTAFALNIAANVAMNEHKSVAIFSLEMSSTLLVKRVLSYMSQVSLSRMNREGGLTRAEAHSVYAAHERLITSRMFIDDGSLVTPTEILSKCRRLKRSTSGLDFVIIDYLQLMSSAKERDSRQWEVAEMSRNMKVFAKELNVPFLVLSQMSRGAEQRQNHAPMLSDLRDSGSIEQDADIVMFLHRPGRYDENIDQSLVELRVEKNRNGECRVINLRWNGETTTFTEIEQGAATQAAASTNQTVQTDDSERIFNSSASPTEQGSNSQVPADILDDDSDTDDTDLPF